MNQARVDRLLAKMNYKMMKIPRLMKQPKGPQGRLLMMQKTTTLVVKHERVEANYNRLDECRGYIEQLISQAIRRGPNDVHMMKLADFWLLEKQLIYKLFDVLVPRYKDHVGAYTTMHNAPQIYPGPERLRAILELKGNPYPPVPSARHDGRHLLHNILLLEAKREYNIAKSNREREHLEIDSS